MWKGKMSFKIIGLIQSVDKGQMIMLLDPTKCPASPSSHFI
jgi:hypothetical protein